MDKYLDLLVTLGFLGALMWGMLKFMLRDIHRDLSDLRSDVQDIKDGQKHFELRMDKMDSRIDHLFEENNRLYHVLLDIVQKK
jgi:hypothetical protein